MLRNPPLQNLEPRVQSFGPFTKDGAGALIGHNGIDFAVPNGTPVLAVQEGTVVETSKTDSNYGAYVILAHSWGQSFYAHLSETMHERGARVSAGEQIGLSGASGRASVPHLHFGMRIAPFSLDDGWAGFSDPAPYLDRLSKPMGAAIGPHIVGGVQRHLELLKRWQPRMILVLDPNPDEMNRLRTACPDSVIIGRVFATDQDIEHRIRQDPEAAAEWAHEKILPHLTPAVDYWQLANEVLQKPDGLPLLNRFELRRMALAESAGYKCAILAFSVGNPDLPEDDRMGHWRTVYPALEHAEEHGHVVALHQYGTPQLTGPPGYRDWLIYRLEHQVLRRLPFKKLKFAVTEYGIDGLINGPSPAGWQRFANPDEYASQLLEAGRYTERFCGRVLGYAVFTLGHNPPWGSYDFAGAVAEQLADRSDKGVWSEIKVTAAIEPAPDTDRSTSPGAFTEGEADPDRGGGDGAEPDDGPAPVDPSEPDVDAGIEEPDSEPVDGDEPAQPEEPDGDQPEDEPKDKPDQNGAGVSIERRLSPAVDELRMRIARFDARPDAPAGDVVYVIKDVFTTLNGSFELSGERGAVTQWARDSYLKPEFLEAGADHHLFAAILDAEGNLISNHPVRYWSDGFDKLADPDYTGFVVERTKESSGWANMFMAGGSSFVPERGESGPWCWAPEGAADVMCGGGLPANHHVSTFVVWQAVNREDLVGGGGLIEEPGAPDPDGNDQDTDDQDDVIDAGVDPDSPIEPGSPTTPPDEEEPGDGGVIGSGPSTVERRLSPWFNNYNMRFVPISERPDSPRGDLVYVVKDVFTTRNGSWEPSNEPGSVEAWARAEYLRPFGAVDYFDDAGGDHHLFAAVIGLDGELLRNFEIIYWSDGIDSLANPEYDGYVRRQTKQHSGWINIPIGPGSSFVPERGESGPWCWMPAGASEVFCGGGLPAKNHVSTFVVWQAVAATDLSPDEEEPEAGVGGDHTTFLPFVRVSQAMRTTARGKQLPAPTPSTAESLVPVAQIQLRAAAWHRLGIEFEQHSALADYARRLGLGMPVTQQFTLGDYLAQGYQGGIVYALEDDWSRIGHLAW